ncbi:hypothetical protein JX266_008416 [Neoarthrinium moseri]|nr:hypothetical protein JX266_008416 [Neoarthrinium moseri]
MARTKQTARLSNYGRAPSRSSHKRSTVVADVWAITEIAENILARLPMKDLLLVQRVSTGWRELIRSSPVLQELLFMRPRGSEGTQKVWSDGVPIREFNPLLIEHMPMWFPKDEGVWRQSVKDAPWAQTVSRLVFLRRDASWRRMLLAQPPFTVFESVQRVHIRGGDSLSVGSVEQQHGVRMGLAYDRAVQSVQGGYGTTLPNHFYTLMDGRVDYDAQGSNMHDGLETSKRIFGGTNKFTLFSETTRGCMAPGYESVIRDRLEQCQFTSAGSESVEIVLHRVERAPGECYSWWTKDGYRES